MPKTETLTAPRVVDGNDLAKMVQDILTGFVGGMDPRAQAEVEHHRAHARAILTIAKAKGDAAPLLGMLLESLTFLTEDDQSHVAH